MAGCEIRSEGDELVCKCGLRWDVKEAPPDRCGKNKRRNVTVEVQKLDFFHRPPPPNLNASVPVVLEPRIAWRMVYSYEMALQKGRHKDEAMQAAYEALLSELP